MGLTSVRIDADNEQHLTEHCKKRGEKTKIINDALKEYFLPKEDKEIPKPTVKILV